MGKHSDESVDKIVFLPIIVIGSADWDNYAAVEFAIRQTVTEESVPVIITSGCPTGAEWFAREVARLEGWPCHWMRDGELIELEGATVLSFILNGSHGATRITDLLSWKFQTRRIEDTVHAPRDERGRH